MLQLNIAVSRHDLALDVSEILHAAVASLTLLSDLSSFDGVPTCINAIGVLRLKNYGFICKTDAIGKAWVLFSAGEFAIIP